MKNLNVFLSNIELDKLNIKIMLSALITKPIFKIEFSVKINPGIWNKKYKSNANKPKSVLEIFFLQSIIFKYKRTGKIIKTIICLKKLIYSIICHMRYDKLVQFV